MRLDLFLKWSRIIPRRTLAKATCDAGRVRINGRVARAGHDVRVDDVITVLQTSRPVRLRVRAIPSRAPGKNGAGDLFEVLDP